MAQASAAVQAARNRRSSTAAKRSVRTEWFINEVSDTVEMTMRQRVTLATELVKNKVIENISRPVTKTRVTGRNRRTRTVVTDRSKPGEYPKADTTTLMKTIFGEVRDTRGGAAGFVGTPLGYGLILEVSQRLDRSYLRRTLHEQMPTVQRILTGPIK